MAAFSFQYLKFFDIVFYNFSIFFWYVFFILHILLVWRLEAPPTHLGMTSLLPATSCKDGAHGFFEDSPPKCPDGSLHLEIVEASVAYAGCSLYGCRIHLSVSARAFLDVQVGAKKPHLLIK